MEVCPWPKTIANDVDEVEDALKKTNLKPASSFFSFFFKWATSQCHKTLRSMIESIFLACCRVDSENWDNVTPQQFACVSKSVFSRKQKWAYFISTNTDSSFRGFHLTFYDLPSACRACARHQSQHINDPVSLMHIKANVLIKHNCPAVTTVHSSFWKSDSSLKTFLKIAVTSELSSDHMVNYFKLIA